MNEATELPCTCPRTMIDPFCPRCSPGVPDVIWRPDVDGHDFHATLKGGWMAVSEDEEHQGYWVYRIYLDRLPGRPSRMDATATDSRTARGLAETAWRGMAP